MRAKRIWYPGAVYHVMHRGVRKSAILYDEEDAAHFIFLMRKYAALYHCRIHAYCLMTTHFHILVETHDSEIGTFVGQISHKYAMYFNRKYGFTGHLFEGRFVSKIVENDIYFLQCSRYIHLNPVKAGIVVSPEQYHYSSFRVLAGMASDLITEVERTLAYFASAKDPSLAYRRFVLQSNEDDRKYEDQIRQDMFENERWLPG